MEESASTEYVTLEGSLEGPEMLVSLFNHAIVGINITHSLIIGGESEFYENNGNIYGYGSLYGYGSKKTHYFDHIAEQWIIGPELLYLRSSHDVGIVRDQAMKQTLVVVTGGYDYIENSGIESTEILIGNNWQQGKMHHICKIIHNTHVWNKDLDQLQSLPMVYHYVLSVLKASLWDFGCQTNVFESCYYSYISLKQMIFKN